MPSSPKRGPTPAAVQGYAFPQCAQCLQYGTQSAMLLSAGKMELQAGHCVRIGSPQWGQNGGAFVWYRNHERTWPLRQTAAVGIPPIGCGPGWLSSIWSNCTAPSCTGRPNGSTTRGPENSRRGPLASVPRHPLRLPGPTRCKLGACSPIGGLLRIVLSQRCLAEARSST